MHHASVGQTGSENQTTQTPVQAQGRGNITVTAVEKKIKKNPKLHQYFNTNPEVKPKLLRLNF